VRKSDGKQFDAEEIYAEENQDILSKFITELDLEIKLYFISDPERRNKATLINSIIELKKIISKLGKIVEEQREDVAQSLDEISSNLRGRKQWWIEEMDKIIGDKLDKKVIA